VVRFSPLPAFVRRVKQPTIAGVFSLLRGSRSRRSFRRGILVAAAGHFDPVQFLFHLMKRIIANLCTGTHAEHGLACCLKGSPVNNEGFEFSHVTELAAILVETHELHAPRAALR
jgi:hypothetical protein